MVNYPSPLCVMFIVWQSRSTEWGVPEFFVPGESPTRGHSVDRVPQRFRSVAITILREKLHPVFVVQGSHGALFRGDLEIG